MRYYAARQRQTDGRWDYTMRQDDRISPVGYCGGYPWTAERLAASQAVLGAHFPGAAHLAKAEAHRAQYHEDGHATQDEAERCYWTHELDFQLVPITGRLSSESEERHRCQAHPGGERCSAWTTQGLALGSYRTHETWLCDAHRTREVFESLHPFAPGLVSAES